MNQQIYSIQRRLTVVIIASAAFVLSAAAVFLDVMIGFQMQELFDAALLDKARALVTLTEQKQDGIEFNFADEIMPEFENESDPHYFQLWAGERTIVERSNSLRGGDLPRFDTPPRQHRFHNITLPDGRAGRLVEISFVPHPGDEQGKGMTISKASLPRVLNSVEGANVSLGTLAVARERLSLERLRFITRAIIFGALLIVLLTMLILVNRFVGRGMRPLKLLANQVQKIDERTLKTRVVQMERQSLELAPIEQQINNLLDRIEAAFNREKRFSADVAHELRTPLAELKTLAEVGKLVPNDREKVEAFFEDVRGVSHQMEQVVTSLLELARSDAGLLQFELSDIALASLVDSVWRHKVSAPYPDKVFENRIADGLIVHTDKEKLEIILHNLLANAAHYSPPQDRIQIYTKQRSQGLELRIENFAKSLTSSDIPRMRERFWRKEHARSDARHAGLGLALVDVLAESLELEVRLELDEDQIFSVVLGFTPNRPGEPGI